MLWIALMLRAAVAAVLAVLTAFLPNHSPAFGLIFFGVWALLQGLAVALTARGSAPSAFGRAAFLLQGTIGVVLGLVALLLSSGGSVGVLLSTVTAFAALTGALELFVGLRRADAAPGSRDSVVAGGLTVVLAIVFLLIPPDAVLAVGLLGGYAAILAVFLFIAGFSLKWGATAQAAPAGPGAEAL